MGPCERRWRPAEVVGRKQHVRLAQGGADPSPLSQERIAGLEVKVTGTEGSRNVRSEAGSGCPHGCWKLLGRRGRQRRGTRKVTTGSNRIEKVEAGMGAKSTSEEEHGLKGV